MHRLTMVGLACLVLALVAGCGDDKNDSSSTPAAAKPAPAESTTAPTTTAESASSTGAVVKVSMKDIKFVPEKISVKVGQKIEWTNDDAVAAQRHGDGRGRLRLRHDQRGRHVLVHADEGRRHPVRLHDPLRPERGDQGHEVTPDERVLPCS